MNASSGISAQDIRAYIRGGCSAKQADYIEKLLLEDEFIFLEYMKELEQLQDTLPQLESPASFADRVMASLPAGTEPLAATRRAKQRWYEHTFFHYALAASITFLILFTGAFDRLTPDRHLLLDQTVTPSYTEEAMKAATGWLDRLKGQP